jgi:hypothetical protein
LSKYIVEAHGGTVEVTSPGEGKGSTFTVRLPIHAVRMREESEEEDIAGRSGEDESAHSLHTADRRPPVRLDGVGVLVVDDEADARRMLVIVLERAGAVVTTADSARGDSSPSRGASRRAGSATWVCRTRTA